MQTHDPFTVAARFVKAADPTYVPPSHPDQLNLDAGLKDVGAMGLAGLGLGVGARGLTGLYNLLKRNVNPRKPSYPGAVLTRVPIPVQDEEKLAANMPAPQSGVADYRNQWWYPGAMLGAGALGLAGGWGGVDALLQKRRKSQSKQEMGDAQKDFEQAMLESYPRPKPATGLDPSAKLAADATDAQKLAAALDELYDQVMEKQGDAKDWLTMGGLISPDTGQAMAGLYGAYAVGSGLLSGKAMYDKTMKTNNRAILQKAIERRNRRAYQVRPSEMLAVPEEVRVPGNEFKPGGPADQTAAIDQDPTEPDLTSTPVRSRKIIRGMMG